MWDGGGQLELVQRTAGELGLQLERAAALGVTVSAIETTLYDAFGSRQVSTIDTPDNQYWVILEVVPEAQRDLAALGSLRVRAANGSLVPIASVDDRAVGNGTPGPISKEIQKTYFQVVRGERPRYEDWLDRV